MPDNLHEYLKARRAPVDVNLKHKSRFKLHDKVAVTVTTAIGSMYALYFFIIFVFGWMLWQSISTQPFDPFPYVFMIFISNIIQLLLLPLIMVGQNIQSKHTQLRAEEEYQTTITIHQDIETILTTLSDLHQKLK
ncbi:MAG: DUF1003 domain-containing protein [Patescibacteria group bacterium]